MKVASRARYGLQATVDLALRRAWKGSGASSVSVKDMAERWNIPEAYLRHILARLGRRGIVKSLRGRSGGYVLTRHPRYVTVLQVMKALGERFDLVFCVRAPSRCRRLRRCPTYPLWGRISDLVKATLSRTTLHSLTHPRARKS